MHTYRKQTELNWVDTHEISEGIEDFDNPDLNQAFGKFCIMDDQGAYRRFLEEDLQYYDEEINNDTCTLVHETVVETLKQVNLVFKNLGIDLEFKQADMVEYTSFMLTGKGDTPEDMALRIRRLVAGKTV